MKINKEYREVMKRGRWLIQKSIYRKQHESAIIVGACMAGCVIIITMAILLGGK